MKLAAPTWAAVAPLWMRHAARNGKRDLASDGDKWRILEAGLADLAITAPPASLERILDRLALERDWSNATYNRHRSLLSAMFGFAQRKYDFEGSFRVARLREQTPEPRPLDREEEARLLAELPLYLARPARFSLTTGARESNVTGLRWWDARRAPDGTLYPHLNADLDTMHVPAAHSKAGKTLSIPLNAAAQATIAEARDCTEHGHPELVFTEARAPIVKASCREWYAALDRAKIAGFKWHGLRTTWTTRHVEAGTPIDVLMRLGGWSTAEVLRKHYVSLAPDVIARYVDGAR